MQSFAGCCIGAVDNYIFGFWALIGRYLKGLQLPLISHLVHKRFRISDPQLPEEALIFIASRLRFLVICMRTCKFAIILKDVSAFVLMVNTR